MGTHLSLSAHLSPRRRPLSSNPPVSESAVTSPISLSDQESLTSSVTRSWTPSSLPATSSRETSPESSTLSTPCLRPTRTSSLLTISSSKREIVSLRLADSTATGHTVVVSSTTTTRPSLSGSTRRISSVSSPCSQVPTSPPSSSVSPEPPLPSRPVLVSLTTTTLVTSPLAQPTSELLSVPPSTSLSPTS